MTIDQASAEGAKQKTLGGRSPDSSTAPDLFARYLDDIEVATRSHEGKDGHGSGHRELRGPHVGHVPAPTSTPSGPRRRSSGSGSPRHARAVVRSRPGADANPADRRVLRHGKVRVFAPTKIGDTIRVHVELKEKEERDDTMGSRPSTSRSSTSATRRSASRSPVVAEAKSGRVGMAWPTQPADQAAPGGQPGATVVLHPMVCAYMAPRRSSCRCRGQVEGRAAGAVRP